MAPTPSYAYLLQTHFENTLRYREVYGFSFAQFCVYAMQTAQRIYLKHINTLEGNEVQPTTATTTYDEKVALDDLKHSFNITCPKVIYKDDILAGTVVFCGERKDWELSESYKGGCVFYEKIYIDLPFLYPVDLFPLNNVSKDFIIPSQTMQLNFHSLVSNWQFYVAKKFNAVEEKGIRSSDKEYCEALLKETLWYINNHVVDELLLPPPTCLHDFAVIIIRQLNVELQKPVKLPRLPPQVHAIYAEDLRNKSYVLGVSSLRGAYEHKMFHVPFMGHELAEKMVRVPVVSATPDDDGIFDYANFIGNPNAAVNRKGHKDTQAEFKNDPFGYVTETLKNWTEFCANKPSDELLKQAALCDMSSNESFDYSGRFSDDDFD